MTCAEWHPDDERLLMRYVEAAGDSSLDLHLRRCRGCASRYSALARDLDAWHRVAADGADADFDAPRLTAQRRRIQQRLGSVVPARVLPFPAAARADRHAPLSRTAAAVLLVALGGAGVLRVLNMPEPPRSRATVSSAATRRPSAVRLVRDVQADAVLEEIDLALLAPRTAELRALDEFTPHVRDLPPPR